jgi:tetratricopeptide (TPR) repeat protein
VALRIVSVLAVLGLFIGGWYFLRSGKDISRTRIKIQKLIQSRAPSDWAAAVDSQDLAKLKASGKDLKDLSTRLELAREASDGILRLAPNSQPDLVLRAKIEEAAGNFQAALDLYARCGNQETEPSWVHLHRASVYRRMGLPSRALAELAAAVDEYPFQSNLEMGKIELEMLQPGRALARLRKTLQVLEESGEAGDERIEVQQLISEALGQLLVRARPASGGGDDDVARLKRERGEALDAAIAQAKSGVALPGDWRRKILLASLYDLHGDPEHLKEGIRILEQAADLDSDIRLPEVRLMLGALQLHDGARLAGSERDHAVSEAERRFQEALNSKPRTLTSRTPGDEPDPDDMAVLIAREFLRFGESWRILAAEQKGRKDPLELSARMDRLLAKGGMGAAARATFFRGIALLEAGNEKEAEESFNSLASGGNAEFASAIRREICDEILRARPASLLFLKFLPAAEERQGAMDLLASGHSIRVLTQAIELRQGGSNGSGGSRPPAVEEEIASLTARRKAIIDREVSGVIEPEDVVSLAAIVSSLNGRDQGIRVLKLGRDRFLERGSAEPRKVEYLRSRLAAQLFEEARALEVEARMAGPGAEGEGAKGADLEGKRAAFWNASRECLAEYLPLMKEYPYLREITSRVLAIIAAFETPGAPPLDLASLIKPLFPAASTDDADALSKLLVRLARGDLGAIIEQADSLKEIAALRPYSILLLGSVLVEEARRIAGSREPAIRARSLDLVARAEALFQAELARSPGELNLRIELARIAVSRLRPGDDPPAALLEQLRSLPGQFGGSTVPYPVYGLLGQALKRRMEFAVKSGVPGRSGLAILAGEWRTALRRAIQSGPEIPESYLALAESYLGIEGSPARPGQAARSFPPEIPKAIQVLRSAPETTPIILRLANLYHPRGGKPRAAIPYYAEAVKREPSEELLRMILSCFSASADSTIGTPDREAHRKARKFLDDFEAALPGLPGATAEFRESFPILKEKLLGLIAQEEARTSPDAASLKLEAIRHYREVRERLRAAGKVPPAEVSNNLAWLLSGEPATVGEALQVIEDLLANLDAAGGTKFQQAVEDTHAWVLYRAGQLDRSVAAYRQLLGRSPQPDFRYHLACALFEQGKYAEAKGEVEQALEEVARLEEPQEARGLLRRINEQMGPRP